ncbi:MAG: hypothetical protein U0984_18820, partial [Prosthecobacter sp.]|nr:hypothetical protein [Prosthecobacter sp.]
MTFGVEQSGLVGTCQGVPDLPPLFATLPILLLCLLAQKPGQVGSGGGRWKGLARLGFGAGKLILLAVPLEPVIRGAIQALPEAQTSTVAWMSLFAFGCQLYLVLSGAVDLLLGARQMLGRGVVEWFGAPFRAGGFTAFWRDWNQPLTKGPDFRRAALSLGAVLLAVVIWRGASWGTLAWAALHLALLGLERWRGRSLFAPLPLPVRAALTLAVVLISSMLLFMPTLEEGLAHVRRLFVTSPATAYSVLLDARLSTPWTITCLWLGGLCCVAMPPASWLLSQSWRGWPIIGILTGIMAGGMLARRGPAPRPDSIRAMIRHAVQWPLAVWMQEGTADVFVGHEGWLYRQSELDRLTMKREGHGSVGTLMAFAGHLRTAGVPLLVIAVPDKVALYPEFIQPAEYAAPVQPPEFQSALDRLRGAGVTVLDPAAGLWRAQKRTPLYFRADSRWTPEATKEVVLAAAKFIHQTWPGVAINETPLINATILDHRVAGDLARALDPW